MECNILSSPWGFDKGLVSLVNFFVELSAVTNCSHTEYFLSPSCGNRNVFGSLANLLMQEGFLIDPLHRHWCLQKYPLASDTLYGIWNSNALFKGITFTLRTEFETEFMFWFEEGEKCY